MNEKGWGLREFLGFIVAIFLAIFIAMIMYHRSFSALFDSSVASSKESYQDIEEDLEAVAKVYTDNYYYKVLEEGDSGYVTVRQLQKCDIINNVLDAEDNRSHCSGYVHFYNDGSTHYDAYIKCGDKYTSDGYKSGHDESVK